MSVYPSPAFSFLLPLHLTPRSVSSLSLYSYSPSLCVLIHAYLFPFSLPLPLSLSCCGDQTCLVCLSAVLCDQSGEWVQKRERASERLCVWLVSQRPEEHAVPFWLGILKAQSHSCCLCVSSPWPHLYKPRPQSQLSNKPKNQCVSIILSNSRDETWHGAVPCLFFWSGVSSLWCSAGIWAQLSSPGSGRV